MADGPSEKMPMHRVKAFGEPLEPISTRPVKSFFVHMLTRDIELKDAILDLLDNCVDGIQRIELKSKLQEPKPYKDYWARITLSKDEFAIIDNCGGIPWELHDYAFRMGHIESDFDKGMRMIGTYGIGMKRAIFKLGSNCIIETHAKDNSYKLTISPNWMKDDDLWDLMPEKIAARKRHGTSIHITELRAAVSKDFDSKTFKQSFYKAIATHYSYIIGKGFKVYLNDETVEPKRVNLLFTQPRDPTAAKHEIQPFIYETAYEGVDIFLAVGFTRGIPSKEEADASLEDYKESYSSSEAGWTVVCNDRTVLYADKTPLTGWGVSGVPQFHMQFIAISGIVVFSSENASLLPMTTTKRGLDANSEIYLHVRDKMIEGMKIFTSYTNVWKGKELVKTSRKSFEKTSTADLDQLRTRSQKLSMSATHGKLKGKQYKPVLPRPEIFKEKERISFTRPATEVRTVSKYLFGTPDKKASQVAEECFSLVLKEALP